MEASEIPLHVRAGMVLFYPGILMVLVGLFGSGLLVLEQVTVGNVSLGIHTLLFCAIFLMIGVNVIILFVMAKLYAAGNLFLPPDRIPAWIRGINEDAMILFGGGGFPYRLCRGHLLRSALVG